MATRRSKGWCAAAMGTLAGVLAWVGLAAEMPQPASAPASRPAEFAAPDFWEMSPPLLGPAKGGANAPLAVKDPSVVFHGGKWHVFMTVKRAGFTGTEYCTFEKWEDADAAPRTPLKLHDGKYFCAPQVFYYTPQKKWYLIYQAGVPGRKFMQVAYSTTDDISKPESWTKAQWVFPDDASDKRTVGGLDYWIICDDEKAWLFFTSLNGKLWRMWTTRGEFPHGFRDCQVALEANIFEASHTYRLKEAKTYLTLVEANPGGKRKFVAFTADRLDGPWREAKNKGLFAAEENVRAAKGQALWADNISHGEIIRDGHDETMTVGRTNMQVVFQGVMQKDKPANYGLIPWRIGVLRAAAK